MSSTSAHCNASEAYPIRHQADALRMLARAVGCDRVPHAYLFHGPDGVGKESLASAFGRMLLCPHAVEVAVPSAERAHMGVDRIVCACGGCEDCHLTRAGTHPDLHVIHRFLNKYHPDAAVRARKAMELGVDVIRHFLIEKAGNRPARNRAKVFLIRQADRITQAAQNAMLKTLEEPPQTTFIILLVESTDRLLETTISRCQVVPFHPLPDAFVREHLTGGDSPVPDEQAHWIARFAQGSLGRARQYAEADLFDLNTSVVSGLAVLAGDRSRLSYTEWTKALKAVAGFVQKDDPAVSETEAMRRGAKWMMAMLAGAFGDVIRLRTNGQVTLTNQHLRSRIESLAARVGAESAAEAIDRIAQAEWQLDRNVNMQLCVETLVDALASRVTESVGA